MSPTHNQEPLLWWKNNEKIYLKVSQMEKIIQL